MSHQFDSGFANLSAVAAPKTTAEAMQLGKMDWTVEESPVVTYGDDNTAPAMVPEWKVLRRSDNKQVLNVCRSSWTPVQNSEAFKWFDPIIADGDVEITTALEFQKGKQIVITAKIKDGIDEVVSGDPVEAFLVLYNSHDGTLSLGIKFSNVRVVCTNMLTAALQSRQNGKLAQIRHTKSIHTNLEAVRDTLDIQRRTFRQSIAEYQAMAKVDLSAAAFDAYLSKVFAKQLEAEVKDKRDRSIQNLRQYEQLIQNFEGGVGMDIKGVRGTAWGAYNAVTEWTTHQRGSNRDTEAARNRLSASWFGSGAQVNELAHSTALSLV
jgi:phage/plasmid-like protein (TIGR03299 family)